VRDVDVQLCSLRSVGLVIEREGLVLLAAPGSFPAGYAPLGAHCDGVTMREAALGLCERIGLQSPVLDAAAEGWRADGCGRPSPDERAGHQWVVYRAGGKGEPFDSRGELRLRWWTRKQLQELGDRTVAYARGTLGDGAWRIHPGLSPVWVGWLAHLRLIGPVTVRDMKAVTTIASRPIGAWR
jgi:hypothetical protein